MPTLPADRRAFLAALGQAAGGACLACALGPAAWATPAGARRRRQRFTHKVDHFETLDNGDVVCGMCPHACVLGDGETGICRARRNIAGVHYAIGYGTPCILQADSIGKLPLLHYRPGSRMLTISSGGCNLRCMYCQNWQQAQRPADEVKRFELSPAEAVAAAKRQGIDTIGFTYTEPTAFLEYARDIAKLARPAGLRVAVGTSLYVNEEPMLDLAKYANAYAVTLKGFDADFYREVCGAELKVVLRNLRLLREKTKCWLEVINLVVPTYNDDEPQLRRLVAWVADALGTDVPLHFARFEPLYQLTDLPRTPVPTLDTACALGREAGLRYVFTSNIAPHKANNTYCDRCGKLLIERLGFKILSNDLHHGFCPDCRNRIPGVWK